MRALTVEPRAAGKGRAIPRLDDVAEPDAAEGAVLCATVGVGLCGTDREIIAGSYGEPPPGAERLVLGHECLGRVVAGGDGFAAGELVVPMVRHPDPAPCAHCAVGEWDMCENGRFTEHGIKGRDGFARERFRADAARLVKVDPGLGDVAVLLEPASVVAKAWEQIERIGARATFAPARVLVMGAGPIGLLAALFGAERGLDVDVVDRAEGGPKPALVRALGARYHVGAPPPSRPGPDVVVECTGSEELVRAAMRAVKPNGIVCLTGLSPKGRTIPVDVAALDRELVLDNVVVFGTVNANRRHYEAAAQGLVAADRAWLARLLTRHVPVTRYADALERRPGDVKTVLTF